MATQAQTNQVTSSPSPTTALDQATDARPQDWREGARRRRSGDPRQLPDYSYRNPETGEVCAARSEVVSPLSGKVVIRYENGKTTFLPDGPCEQAVQLIKEKGAHTAFDPIFLMAAGIFDYQSHQTPVGRKGYVDELGFGAFIRDMPYELKRDWKEIVGLPFPFLYMQRYTDHLKKEAAERAERDGRRQPAAQQDSQVKRRTRRR